MTTRTENQYIVDDDFDPEIAAFFRYLGLDDDELWEEIEVAKALLKREGYIVL